MPRPTSRKKDPLSTAMILMRQQLGMTQTQLAHALKVALPTIGRWESWDPPKGIMLERLARFAEFGGLPVAAEFRHALEKEHSGPLPPWFRLESDEESKYVRALLLILREPEFAKVRPRLHQLMAPAFKAAESVLNVNEDRHLRLAKAELEAETASKPRPKKKPEN